MLTILSNISLNTHSINVFDLPRVTIVMEVLQLLIIIVCNRSLMIFPGSRYIIRLAPASTL